MKGKISKDVLFGIFVVLLFLSTPLFMTYLPNMSRFEIYFFKNPEIREPLLKVPLLLHDAGMDKLAVCRIYLFLINLFTCVSSWYAFSRITDNQYAGLLGSMSYSLCIYSMTIRYDKGLLGEAAAYAIVPLAVCGLWGLIKRDKKELGFWAFLLAAGLIGIVYSCISFGFIIYASIILVGIVFGRKLSCEHRWLWLMTASAVSIIAALPILAPWIVQMGGIPAVARYGVEIIVSDRIRLVWASAWSMAISLLGGYVYRVHRQKAGIFFVCIVMIQIFCGIFFMNELLYSTERENMDEVSVSESYMHVLSDDIEV